MLPEAPQQQAPEQAGAAQPPSSSSSATAGPNVPGSSGGAACQRQQRLQRMYVGQLPEGTCLYSGGPLHGAGNGACSSGGAGGGIGSEWSDVSLHGPLQPEQQHARASGSGAAGGSSREALQLQQGGPEREGRRRWWRMGDVAYLGAGVYLWGE